MFQLFPPPRKQEDSILNLLGAACEQRCFFAWLSRLRPFIPVEKVSQAWSPSAACLWHVLPATISGSRISPIYCRSPWTATQNAVGRITPCLGAPTLLVGDIVSRFLLHNKTDMQAARIIYTARFLPPEISSISNKGYSGILRKLSKLFSSLRCKNA